MDVRYPDFTVRLELHSLDRMTFAIDEGPFAHSETVAIDVVPLGNSMFAVSWTEASGATVTNVQDYDRAHVHSFITLPDGRFLRMNGPMAVTRAAPLASDARPERNKALVLEAMTSLFQHHDASAVDRLYAADYVQHNPTIAQGRDALRSLVAALSPEVFYEPGLVIAEGDLVAIHGRIRGWADVPQVVVDLFRVQGGKLAEHWDVLQDEVPATGAAGGISMFDPGERAAAAPSAR
ncbi:nuclear transport factor 2 family protein [Stenotrophomonas cyclobalanopsidis]|nr:nuclear transport factor 2 family protein [Stenotrophomonas cyclobalanopsidis]